MEFLREVSPRDYQEKIFQTCAKKNCLVVLPTGLGKTLIALMLTVKRMTEFPGEKVLFLAPTKPLVEQHFNYFKKHLTELFGEHKLETRSTQLFEAGENNDLIVCERKGKNKNRSVIYFSLADGAEWIIAGLFPDARLITLQQAIAMSFLRYSQDFLIRPWEISSIDFNYLLDIWFRSFLYTNNLDMVVFEKAKEHVRERGGAQ